MTDRRQRTLARAAAQGDPQAAAALLRSRLRAGELTRERVDLAAYVGHEASRKVLGRRLFALSPKVLADPLDLGFSLWLRGLEAYGQQAMLRAAAAAARAAWSATYGDLLNTSAALGGPLVDSWRAIEAFEAWLASPTKERHDSWHNACAQVSTELDWLPDPIVTKDEWPDVIQIAAWVAGEQAVRDAIRAALVPWALGVK